MSSPARRLPILLLLLLAVPVLLCLWLGVYALSPGPASSREQIEVIIPARASLPAIASILAENGVIHDDPRFSLLAVLTGAAAKLRAGEYAFVPGTKPLDVIALLKKGRVLYRAVTIPEGTELAKIGGILAADGWVEQQHFLDLTRDPELRWTPKGTAVATASIAINRYKKMQDGSFDERVTFVDVDFFKQPAERLASDFRKGNQILVEASIHQEKWTDKKTGVARSKLAFMGTSLYRPDPKPPQEETPPQEAAPQSQQGHPHHSEVDPGDGEDFPF